MSGPVKSYSSYSAPYLHSLNDMQTSMEKIENAQSKADAARARAEVAKSRIEASQANQQQLEDLEGSLEREISKSSPSKNKFKQFWNRISN